MRRELLLPSVRDRQTRTAAVREGTLNSALAHRAGGYPIEIVAAAAVARRRAAPLVAATIVKPNRKRYALVTIDTAMFVITFYQLR
jgi:hypothetical protein